ncbi:hypothetical protein NGA_0619300, partial [Nannochloropsis gaditana CCMP526]
VLDVRTYVWRLKYRGLSRNWHASDRLLKQS